MVLKLISALLRANESTQQEFYSRHVPLGVFPTHQAQLVWLTNFRETHRQYPSLAAYKNRFPNEPLPSPGRETVWTLLTQATETDLLNRFQEALTKAHAKLKSGDTPSSTLNFCRELLSTITDPTAADDDVILGQNSTADANYRERQLRRANNELAYFNLTPWKPVNEILGYSTYGEHIVLAARLGLGKTWLAIFMADHLARRGERVLFLSKEMTTENLTMRFEACVHKLPYTRFRTASMKPGELSRWRQEAYMYAKSKFSKNLIISGSETVKGGGFGPIISKIERYDPTIVMVDGAYLLQVEGKRFSSDVQRWTFLSNESKRMAKVRNVRWMSIIQGNREGENKDGDTKPSISTIYGADAWAQDADIVLLVGGRRGSNSRTLAIGKSRESGVGEIAIGYKLDPFPNFPVLIGATAATSQGLKFNGT